MARRVVKRTKRLQQRRRATKPSAPRKVKDGPKATYIPKGSDPLLKCPKCHVWSARVDFCSNCKEARE